MTEKRYWAWSMVVLLFLTPVLAGCGKKATDTAAVQQGPARGKSTPEEAFEAFRSAASKNDTDAMLDVVTEDSLSVMAGGLVFAASFVAAFEPDKAKDLEALMKKHGIDQDGGDEAQSISADGIGGALKAIGESIDDKRSFISELAKIMQGDDSENGFMALGNAKLGEVTITDDVAKATMVTADGSPEPIEFQRANGLWLVRIPEPEMQQVEGSGFDRAPSFDRFDFEQDESVELPPVDVVTADQLDSWKKDFDIQDQPAGTTLEQLAKACGMQVYNADEHAEALSKNVTLKLEGVSPLQAIEQLCQQINVYPRYRVSKLALSEGPRPYPVVFAGPFLVEVTQLDEVVPYAVGSLQLKFVATGLPVSVISQLKQLTGWNFGNNKKSTVNLTGVTGTGGKDLLDSNNNGRDSVATLQTVLFSRSVRIKNLLHDVQSIDRIAGQIDIALPKKIDKLSFEKLEKGATAKMGEVELTLGTTRLSDQNSTVSIDYEGAKNEQLTLIARDENDKLLKINGSSGYDSDGGGNMSAFFEGRPDSLQVWIVRDTEDLAFPFELPAIALKSYAKMPETIAPLEFEGDSPVRVQFEKLSGSGNQKKIEVSVTNQSNRDIRGLHMQIEYLSGTGDVMKESPHSHNGPLSMAPAGKTVPLKFSAFFMPEGAKTCRVNATTVWFSDNSEWKSKE